MLTITRRLEIDAGHRLMKHESKCRNLHGHRYRFDITVSAPELDEVGRVIDFGKVKELVGGWLDRNWDHGMLLQEGDPFIEFVSQAEMKLYVMKTPPSIEHMVQVVMGKASELLSRHGICVVHVRGYETPNCWADCSND